MNTRFLSDEEVEQVQHILNAHGMDDFDAVVQLWGRGKSIHVSGKLDQRDLRCLLAIVRYLDDAAPASILSSDCSLSPIALRGRVLPVAPAAASCGRST